MKPKPEERHTMILSEIRHYLEDRKQVTLGDLAIHFDTDPDAMRGMLNQWMRKGMVVKSESRAGCSKKCGNCSGHAVMEIYEWRP